MYGPGGPNKDLHERAEEMERMREHVFSESDLNGDGLIDFQEFMEQTRRAEYKQDQGKGCTIFYKDFNTLIHRFLKF